MATYTKSTFDDFLVANKTAKYIAHLVPLYYISIKIPIVLDDFVYWENLFGKSVKIFIIILSLFIVRSVFNSLKDYLKTLPKYLCGSILINANIIDNILLITNILVPIFMFIVLESVVIK